MYILIQLLSFLLPFQLSYHFRSLAISVYGFEIDYLIPAIYITDIAALFVIAFGVRYIKFTKSLVVFLLLFIVFASLNILISDHFAPSLYRWLKIAEMLLLGLVLFNAKAFDVFKHFIKPLSFSVFIVCFLGILQYLVGGSIDGAFYFLGERTFSFSDLNVAPFPYSTFSHPNSFAGFLLVFVIFLIQYRKKFGLKYFWTLAVLVSTNLFLTNSLNVYIAIALLVLISFRKNVHSSLSTVHFADRFITHRLELIEASWQMIKRHFWFGVGLNNFIPNLVKVSSTYINAWELQPVHNIFLLTMSEVGVLGLIAFLVLVFTGFSVTNYPLLAILMTGLNDHYWLTLQQNMLLFTYVLVISKTKKN